MEFWLDLLASGNIVNILILVVSAIIIGGTGAAIVNAISTHRRGIRGDALTKDQLAIDGLGTLTEGQHGFITQITAQLATVKTEAREELAKVKQDSDLKYNLLSNRFDAEIQYSNTLIVLLAQNGIPAPPRPPVLETDDV